jgi:hypothetical protein
MVVRLVKLDADDYEYPMVVLRDDGTHLVVRGPWAEAEARDVGPVTFEPGDDFTEHYWRDRWYAVKEVRRSDGALKGWYCDVARPARVQPGVVVSEDLVLDLWVAADGTVQRLDEDEFASSGLERLDPVAAREAPRALKELEALAAERWHELLAG